MKKSWCLGIALLFFGFISKTTCAATNGGPMLGLPVLPDTISERVSYLAFDYGTKCFYKSAHSFVNAVYQVDYYKKGTGTPIEFTHWKKNLIHFRQVERFNIHRDDFSFETEDVFDIRNRFTSTLRIILEERPEYSPKQWTYRWQILDEKGQVIKDPIAYAKVKAKAYIRALSISSEEERQVLLNELEAKDDYRHIINVCEKAEKWCGATDVMKNLYNLLYEKKNLLTDYEIYGEEGFQLRIGELKLFKKQEDIQEFAKSIEKNIETTANKTIPSFSLIAEAPRAGEALVGAISVIENDVAVQEFKWIANGKEAQEGDVAKENTAYTLRCKLVIPNGKRIIRKKLKATINGEYEGVALDYKDKGYILTYTFPQTGTAPKIYRITWDANGGEGEMAAIEVQENNALKLPKSTFIPPDGKIFDAWGNEERRYQAGKEINVTGDIKFQALWKDKSVSTELDGYPSIDILPREDMIRIEAKDGSGAYLEGNGDALKHVQKLVVNRKDRNHWTLLLCDKMGDEVYSDAFAMVTVPLELIGRDNLRILVDGVYTSYAISEDGKNVTFPAYFTEDGKRPQDEVLFQSMGIEIRGSRSVMGQGTHFVLEKKGTKKFDVKLVNAIGERVHTKGPVWISFPSPDDNLSSFVITCDGRATTFEVENERVRIAGMI